LPAAPTDTAGVSADTGKINANFTSWLFARSDYTVWKKRQSQTNHSPRPCGRFSTRRSPAPNFVTPKMPGVIPQLLQSLRLMIFRGRSVTQDLA
jgi:hypothetical protein